MDLVSRLLRRRPPASGDQPAFPAPSGRALLLALAPFALLLPAGCGEEGPYGPVSLEAIETLPAVHFGIELPGLPAYVERWADGTAADAEMDAWRRSWERPGPEGERIRTGLHRTFARVLGTAADPSELEREVDRLDGAIAQVDAVLGARLPSHLLPTMADARDARDAARRALEAGDGEGVVLHLLQGFDRLRSATPGSLARELLAEGESLFAGAVNGGSAATEDVQRAERLMIGARDALENGTPVVALRRAWYAVRLLEEEDPR